MEWKLNDGAKNTHHVIDGIQSDVHLQTINLCFNTVDPFWIFDSPASKNVAKIYRIFL